MLRWGRLSYYTYKRLSTFNSIVAWSIFRESIVSFIPLTSCMISLVEMVEAEVRKFEAETSEVEMIMSPENWSGQN